jgi:hypothetical protein
VRKVVGSVGRNVDEVNVDDDWNQGGERKGFIQDVVV